MSPREPARQRRRGGSAGSRASAETWRVDAAEPGRGARRTRLRISGRERHEAGYPGEAATPELRAYWDRFFPTDTAATIGATGGRREYFRRFMGVVYAMHSAGVSILAGTDVGAPYVYPGFSLHDELALLVEAGMPPADVLRAATSGAASFLGVSDSVGTVQVGELADLVIIDGNPLADIRNTQSIHAVIVNGRVLDAAERRRVLAATARAASAGKAERRKL